MADSCRSGEPAGQGRGAGEGAKNGREEKKAKGDRPRLEEYEEKETGEVGRPSYGAAGRRLVKPGPPG